MEFFPCVFSHTKIYVLLLVHTNKSPNLVSNLLGHQYIYGEIHISLDQIYREFKQVLSFKKLNHISNYIQPSNSIGRS